MLKIQTVLLRCGWSLGLVLAALLLATGPAVAGGINPLAGLTAPISHDAVLVSGNGLQFSGFGFHADGLLDPAQFEALVISATSDGLQISGPLSVANGDGAALYVTYQVTATGAAANGVTLAAQTSIVDGGFPTFAKVEKSLFDGSGGLANVKTQNFAGLIIASDSASFAPSTMFTVMESIRLSSGGPGGSAAVSLLTNSFTVVPEPMSALLLGIGLLGLARAGRRRS